MTGSAGLRPIGEIAADMADQAATAPRRKVSDGEIIARYLELEAEATGPAGADHEAILAQVASELGEPVSRCRSVMLDRWFSVGSG